MYSYGPPHMAGQKQDDQVEHTYSSYVKIRDVALKTCQRRWTIGNSGERESGVSVPAARHDDDDDMVSSIPNEHEWSLNRSIWFEDESLTGTTTPGQSGHESYAYENVFTLPRSPWL